MNKILIAILSIFMLSACSLEKMMEKNLSEKSKKKLCQKYELAICGEVKIPTYNNASIEEIKAISYDMIFTYKKDDGEQYDYMESNPMEGDCEDWTITFIENNLRAGNFRKGQVQWILGKVNGEGHAWTLVTVNGETFLYDNGYTQGVQKDYAYEERKYRELLTVYEY